jgi:nucleoid DNA-binding protein
MNKIELIDMISHYTGLAKRDVAAVINEFIEVVGDQLAAKNNIKLVDFGTFKLSHRKARIGVIPKTKNRIQIPAAVIPAFSPGKGLKEKVK